MKPYQILTLIPLATTMISCASLTGTAFMQGEMKNGIYSPTNKTFEVAVPFKSPPELDHMQVKEQETNEGTFVTFGPAAFDQKIFRTGLIWKLTGPSRSFTSQEIGERIVAGLTSQLEDYYKSPVKTISKETINVSNRMTHVWKLRHDFDFRGQHLTHLHEVYVQDFNDRVLFAAIELPQEGVSLIGSSMTPLEFVKSLKLAREGN